MIAPEIESLSQARSFSGVWSWYLSREFRDRGIELMFDDPLYATNLSPAKMVRHYQRMNLRGIDHVLAIGTRYFERVHPDCGAVLKSRCRGVVAQLHDNGRGSMSCDLTFTLRRSKLNDRNHYVGWAADFDILTPKQEHGELRILIDHPDYSFVRKKDRSVDLVRQCLEFQRSGSWRDRYDSVRVRRLVDGGVEDVTTADVPPYERNSIPFVDVCEEYSKTHLFVVTHPESVGMSVIETAAAGALPLVPEGFIHKDRLATVRRLTFDQDIPWVDAMREIDVSASREKASDNSWYFVAERMMETFRKFRKRKTH